MRKLFTVTALAVVSVMAMVLLCSCRSNGAGSSGTANDPSIECVAVDVLPESASGEDDPVRDLYGRLRLEPYVGLEAFEQAVSGYMKISSRNKDILTLIDFSKPSTEERLFVIDMALGQVLFRTHVSHGRNSGENYATSFSNVKGSYKSSLGFYLTENSYQGGNGYSLILDGLEKGINDRAKPRGIVIHPAGYANPSVIRDSGRLGRSLGCPALPQAVSKDIIDVIKDGSVLFIYAGDEDYASSSTLLTDVG